MIEVLWCQCYGARWNGGHVVSRTTGSSRRTLRPPVIQTFVLAAVLVGCLAGPSTASIPGESTGHGSRWDPLGVALCRSEAVFADGFESADLTLWSIPGGAPLPSCEMSFLPPSLNPGDDATVLWSAEGADRCVLSCDDGSVFAEVGAIGSRIITSDDAFSCDLCCGPAGGGPTAQCNATIPLAGSCDAPTCDATITGGPTSGYFLEVDTTAQGCAYSCPGLRGGEMDCDAPLPLGKLELDCRVWAISDCGSLGRCSTRAWNGPIVVDGNLDDWPVGTRFPTAEGWNYVSWDEETVFAAMQHPALGGQVSGELSVMLYLGNGQDGLAETTTLGTQMCYLPVPMSHAVRLLPAFGEFELLVVSGSGDWQPDPHGVGSISTAGDAAAGTVEIAVPRSLLGLEQHLYLHLDIVDQTIDHERSFASTPYGSHSDSYLDAGSICWEVAEFDPDDWVQPNSAPPYEIATYDDFPFIAPPDEDTAFSLRIATFNGAYVDVPVGESDMEAHIAAVCAIGAGIGALVDIPVISDAIDYGMPSAWLAFPPLDPLLWFGFCEAAVHMAIAFNNEALEEGAGGSLSHEKRAREVAMRILALDLDVVALNEVFVEDARDRLVHYLKNAYPYVVGRVEPPSDTTIFEIFEPHFGAYFVQDSGLMVFSRYPFLPLSSTSYLAPDDEVDLWWQGVEVNNSSKNAVAFKQFNDHPCNKEDCNAGKGVGLVRVEKSPQERVTVVFSHMQASYGSDEQDEREAAMDIRLWQMGDIQTLIDGSLTAGEKEAAEVVVLGDLNIMGRFPDGEGLNQVDWPDWDPAHEDFAAAVDLNPNENRDWDLGRQEWLHHFCGLRSGLPGETCENANPGESYLDDPVSPGYFACGDGTRFDCPDSNGKLLLVDSWAFDTSPHDVGRTQGGGAWDPALTTCSPEGEACFENGDPGCVSPPPYDRLRSSLCSGQRLDYILHNTPTIPGSHGATTTCAQHMTIAWELSGAGGTQPLSDHLPIRGDFNRWAPFCRPREAVVVDETVLTAWDNNFEANTSDNINYQIALAGGMQWFRIDEPGSYSIGIGPHPDVGYVVYQEEDLSRPRPSYHEMVSDWGTRYHLPKPPYYVRIFATKDALGTPDREAITDYNLTIHRHDCTSADDACMLPAGSWLHPAVWPDERFTVWEPADPHYYDGFDALWFIFTTYNDDRGIAPDVSFGNESRWIENYDLEIVEFCGASGYCPGPHAIVVGSGDFDVGPVLTGCELCQYAPLQLRAETQLGGPDYRISPKGKSFFLRVLRETPLDANGDPCQVFPCGAPVGERTAGLRFGSNLTFFYPDTIELIMSEDDAGGDVTDELWYFLDVDAASPTTTQTSSYLWLGEVVEGGPKVGIDMMGVRSFAENMFVNIYSSEEPNASVDDTDPEWFEPRSGHHACSGAKAAGDIRLCPLAEEFVGSSAELDGSRPYLMYSDDPDGDEDDADYKAFIRYCLVHEYVQPKQGQTLLDACLMWGEE